MSHFPNILVFELRGLQVHAVCLEAARLPPLAKLVVRNCPLLCASPGVAALFKFADGIDEIDVDGAAPWPSRRRRLRRVRRAHLLRASLHRQSIL